MPIVHFKGKILPYEPSAFTISIRDLPSVTWSEQNLAQTLKITSKIEASVIDIEFDVQVFNENDPALLLNRAWDLARAAVDLYSFQVGWGLGVVIDTMVTPDGRVLTILPKMETLAHHSTAVRSADPKVNNFDACYRILVSEPALFMAMNDLIVSITLPHHAVVNCARVIEGLRSILAPGVDRKQTWLIMQAALNAEGAYLSYVTDLSAPPRHGDKAWIPGPTVIESTKRTWIVMNRFLEFRKRGSQPLPIAEFPLLKH